jgi:hypothetical protein
MKRRKYTRTNTQQRTGWSAVWSTAGTDRGRLRDRHLQIVQLLDGLFAIPIPLLLVLFLEPSHRLLHVRRVLRHRSSQLLLWSDVVNAARGIGKAIARPTCASPIHEQQKVVKSSQPVDQRFASKSRLDDFQTPLRAQPLTSIPFHAAPVDASLPASQALAELEQTVSNKRISKQTNEAAHKTNHQEQQQQQQQHQQQQKQQQQQWQGLEEICTLTEVVHCSGRWPTLS